MATTLISLDEDALLDLLCGHRTAPVVVGHLSVLQMRAIGSLTSVIWLSRETVHKQETKHRARDFDLYRLAPTIIQFGEARRTGPRHLAFLYSRIMEPKRPYRAFVKTTGDGREVFLDSIHRIGLGQVARALERSEALSWYMKPRKQV
jgi:hypothetical protein